MMNKASNDEAGCNICWPADAEAAYSASTQLTCVANLIDESHFIVRVLVCKICGQKFLSIFTETVDWFGGDDPQNRSVFPITESESEFVMSLGDSISEKQIQAIGSQKKYVEFDSPKGKPPTTCWGTSFFIGPHD